MGESAQIIIPAHLLRHPLPKSNHNPLSVLADQNGLVTFEEVTPDVLRVLYAQNDAESRRLFWRVVGQMAFFGAIFTSPLLRSKNVLSDHRGCLFLWPHPSVRSEPMEWWGAASVRAQAADYGLIKREDAFGTALKALELLDPQFHVEPHLREAGFEMLSADEINAREIRGYVGAPNKPVSVATNGSSLDQLSSSGVPAESPVLSGNPTTVTETARSRSTRFTVLDRELVLPATAQEVQISPEDLPNCPALARKLNEAGYTTWGSLPYELDDLLLGFKGVGKSHLKKFSDSLTVIAAKLSKDVEAGEEAALSQLMKTAYWQSVHVSVLREVPVSSDTFSEFPHMVEKLWAAGFENLGDFTRVPDVETFLQGLEEDVPHEAGRFARVLDSRLDALKRVRSAKTLWYRDDFVVLADWIQHVPLNALNDDKLTMLRGLAQKLSNAGYETLGDLPASLSLAVEDNEETSSEEVTFLFDLIALHSSRVGKGLGSFVLDPLVEYAVAIARSEVPEEYKEHIHWKRGWDLLQTRLDHQERGDKLTLAQMGEILGVTRERARQVQSETLKALARPYAPVLAEVHALLQEPGYQFSPLRFFVSQTGGGARTELVLNYLLGTQKIHLNHRYGILSTFTTRERQRLLDRLEEQIRDRFEGEIFTEEELAGLVDGFVEEEKLSAGAKSYLSRYATNEVLTILHDGRMGYRLTKERLAAHVLKEYCRRHPEGAALPRDAALFRQELDRIEPNVFANDRNFVATVQRSEKAVLWGRGTYTHLDVISVSPSDIEMVVRWIEQRFQWDVPHLSSRAAFFEFRSELEEAGVPNDYALYSCLRLFYPERFFLAEYPKIFPIWQTRNLSNSDLLKDHLRREGDQSFADLQAEFMDNRGWHLFQLSNTLMNTKSVVRVDRATYGLLGKHQTRGKKALSQLADYLESLLSDEVDSVSIKLLLDKRKATCVRLGIDNEYLLYSLMSVRFDGRFLFPQFPHVVKHSVVPETGVSNRGFVENFVREVGEPVLKEELQREFVGRRGWGERELNNSLLALTRGDQVLQLRGGPAAEFVHREVVGWDEDKQERFEAWVQDVAEDLNRREFPFGNVRRALLDQSRLPELRGVRWTEDLLKTKLEKLETVLLLGSRRSIFVTYPNAAGVEDEEDFIAYVVTTEFGGATKIQALQDRLSELDPEISQLKRLGSKGDSDLPYHVIGDEILLKQR